MLSRLASAALFPYTTLFRSPVTFVRRELESSSPAAALRAASTPSWVTVACPTHGAESLVVQTQSGVSKTSARRTTGLPSTRELVRGPLPTALHTTTV